ncbi:putative invertase inhibitor [Ziziphus jujuba]|uniref:Invertase inhibitor n=1 Tax=Ziziphus jujuba TaxID=326968 RepID=A0A6P3YT57_ZIZJJ|nr:putative invertase inhibitor [Ziziphus jujuba]
MWHISFFSILYFCLFFLIIPHQTAISIDIINQTCKKCSDESNIFSYEFCSVSLQAVPASHVTNLQGLALIAMELALDNATNTISIIKQLLTNETADPFALECLKDCLEVYSEAVTMLVDSIAGFLEEHYDTARVWLSAVMEVATTCADGFKEKEGVVYPLENENYSLFQLSDIALCITHLLSQVVRS